jgi:hypothetical protein
MARFGHRLFWHQVLVLHISVRCTGMTGFCVMMWGSADTAVFSFFWELAGVRDLSFCCTKRMAAVLVLWALLQPDLPVTKSRYVPER